MGKTETARYRRVNHGFGHRHGGLLRVERGADHQAIAPKVCDAGARFDRALALQKQGKLT